MSYSIAVRTDLINPASLKNQPNANKIKEKIKSFGWEHLLKYVDSHIDFFSFLYDSKLLYTIRGYQNSLQSGGEIPAGMEELAIGIKLVNDQPCILKQGVWSSWDTIKNEIYFDPERREIFSHSDQTTEWNYFYNPINGERGLCPQSRYNQIRPIYQIDAGRMDALGVEPGQCALQIFTTENSMFAKISHVGLRLIDQNGRVYSLGFETPSREVHFAQQRVAGNYNAEITSLDYDEFAQFKRRRVTTLPLTSSQFQSALQKEQSYTERQIRFNRVRQNCATHALTVMKAAKQPTPSIDISLGDFFWDIIKEAPLVGNVLDRIKNLVEAIFSLLSALPIVHYVADAVIFVKNRISIFLSNLVIFSFGASNGSDLDKCVEVDSIDNTEHLVYFTRLYKNGRDIFKQNLNVIFSPHRLVDWQLGPMKARTQIYEYEGPKLYI